MPAFNAEFTNKRINDDGSIREELISTEDGSLLGWYRLEVSKSGRVTVTSKLIASGITREETREVKNLFNLIGAGRGVLRKRRLFVLNGGDEAEQEGLNTAADTGEDKEVGVSRVERKGSGLKSLKAGISSLNYI